MNSEKPQGNRDKKQWVWVPTILLIVSIIGDYLSIADTKEFNKTPDSSVSSTIQDVQPSKPSIKEDPAKEDTVEEKHIMFELVAGEPGEYGKLFTINKDTEFEETYYIYRIPIGTYTVTNTGEYMNQFNVYGETVYVTKEGFEELSDTYYVKLLDVGESDTFTFDDGQIIEIHEPGKFTLELISEGETKNDY